jgi:hypothetical protein
MNKHPQRHLSRKNLPVPKKLWLHVLSETQTHTQRKREILFYVLGNIYKNITDFFPVKSFQADKKDIGKLFNELIDNDILLIANEYIRGIKCNKYTFTAKAWKLACTSTEFVINPNGTILNKKQKFYGIDNPKLIEILRHPNLFFNRHEAFLIIQKFGKTNEQINTWRTIRYFPHGELKSNWEKHPCGRIYSSQPAIQIMPKAVRSAVYSLNGTVLSFDYSAMHLNLILALSHVEPVGDPYAVFKTVIPDRDRVKRMLNGSINRMHKGQWMYKNNFYESSAMEWDNFDTIRNNKYPPVIDFINKNNNDTHVVLQTLETEITTGILSEIGEGFPLHDGIVIPEHIAKNNIIQPIADRISFEKVGYILPYKISSF